MKVTASHNYLCHRGIYNDFKDTVPRSISMQGVHVAIFDAIVDDPNFRETIVAEGCTAFFEGKDFVWVNLIGLPIRKRKQINKAIREVLAKIDRLRETEGHLGIAGVVTVAYRLCTEGNHKLQFS